MEPNLIKHPFPSDQFQSTNFDFGHPTRRGIAKTETILCQSSQPVLAHHAGAFRHFLCRPYAERIAHLREQKIALWDVLHSCERTGSSDSAILNPIPNNFTSILAKNSDLQAIAFNGAKAAKWFHRWAKIDTSGLKIFRLPSTNPAATIAFEKKCAAWTILQGVL